MANEANAGDPNNAGALPESSLANLEANIAAELNPENQPAGSQPDANATDAPPASSPASGDTPSSPEPAAADPPVEDPIAEAAKTQRISQENARFRETLSKLGVDPDSQTAEHLRSGLITPEEFVRSRYQPAATPGQPATNAAPEIPLNQKLINLQSTLASQKGKDLKTEDYLATQDQFMDVITTMASDNRNIQADSRDRAVQDLQSKNIAATGEVFAKTVTTHLPAEAHEMASDLVLGATDIAVGKLAQQVGQQKALTPAGYAYAARGVSDNMNKVVEAAYKAGHTAALNNINPPANPINPLTPGVGGTPPATPPAPKGKFDIQNLDANVAEELAKTEVSV